MRVGVTRLLAIAACAAFLAGCESSAHLNDTTGSIGAGGEVYGEDPKDDLSLGKRHYREQNYGLAEKHFRRVVEAQPRTAEAWVGSRHPTIACAASIWRIAPMRRPRRCSVRRRKS
jgi:hypothetical protein